MQNDIVICPACGNTCYFNIDGFGHTPIHLHCDKCDINIGSSSFKKCIDLFQQYHKPKTYLEFYHNEIKLLFEEGKRVIYAE